MHTIKPRLLALALLCLLATACTLQVARATPTALVLPTLTLPPPTPTFVPLLTPVAIPTTAGVSAGTSQPFVTQVALPQSAATNVPAATFCADAQVTTLINNLKTALQTSNGSMFASLVSPTHGMEARLYRNGRIVTYDQQHAKFLFESTYSVDWGAAPGSGQQTTGSFHQAVIPDLLDVFSKSYTLTCNQVQVGGASYSTAWPYPGVNYYSVYYPGTAGNGNMDWHTWLLGMHYVGGHPYLYSLVQFKWEP